MILRSVLMSRPELEDAVTVVARHLPKSRIQNALQGPILEFVPKPQIERRRVSNFVGTPSNGTWDQAARSLPQYPLLPTVPNEVPIRKGCAEATTIMLTQEPEWKHNLLASHMRTRTPSADAIAEFLLSEASGVQEDATKGT